MFPIAFKTYLFQGEHCSQEGDMQLHNNMDTKIMRIFIYFTLQLLFLSKLDVKLFTVCKCQENKHLWVPFMWNTKTVHLR
jgi:hypothetical protein